MKCTEWDSIRFRIMTRPIVAFALLTEPELRGLGAAFDRAWPVSETTDFDALLRAIDKVDRVPRKGLKSTR